MFWVLELDIFLLFDVLYPNFLSLKECKVTSITIDGGHSIEFSPDCSTVGPGPQVTDLKTGPSFLNDVETCQRITASLSALDCDGRIDPLISCLWWKIPAVLLWS